MKNAVLAALLLGAVPAASLAQTETPPVAGTDAPAAEVTNLDTGEVTIVFDRALSQEFEVNRAIVERVQAEFGEHAVYDNGQDLPEGLEDAIAPGNTLPDTAEVRDVPEQLGDLPTLGTGTHWVAVGEHLVEVTPDNTIVMVVYDALP